MDYRMQQKIENLQNKQSPARNAQGFMRSEKIIVRNVLHDIFHPAFQNIAQTVDGVNFHIQIFP